MSRPPKFSPKGRFRKTRITVEAVLEALHRIETAEMRPYPATIAEVAAEVPCCRNSAMDLLAALQNGPLVELKSVRVTGKRPARAYVLSFAGRLRVERLLEARREIDPATAAERFERAAEKLEAEAAAIEARLADQPYVDPRQASIEMPGGAA